MTRDEYVVYRDEVLKKRFYLCHSAAEKRFLAEKGHRFLYRCTHFKNDKYFWIYDKTDELLADVKLWKENKEKVSDTSEHYINV